MNCTKNTIKVAASFGIILLFFTGGVFLFIFHFWKRSLSWRFKEFNPKQAFTDADIAQQSIFINHLPKTVSMQMMTLRVKEVFEKMFSEEKVVSVRVIPKMDDLLEKGNRLRINKDKLAYYK